MTTYTLNPNYTWLAVYNLNTGTMPTNNVVFSEIAANLTASATSIAVKTGEGALFSQGMIATLEQLDATGKKATAREVVLISGISGDTLTLTRGYENCVMDDFATPKQLGNTPQAFTSGARISVYISRALLHGVQTRLQQVNCPCNTAVYNQEMALTSCIANNCDDWRDALYKEKARRCYNDCGFGDGSDGDCVISEDAFLCANCNYNFKNLTICSGVLVRFRGAGTPRINVQRKFCNMGTIDLRGGDYVGACSKKDCITGCTVSNNYCSACYNAMCFGCGGAGGGGACESGYAGSNATGSGGGAGGNGGKGYYCYISSSGSTREGYETDGGVGCPADGYNGGNGGYGGSAGGSVYGDYCSANRPGGGGGGGGGYFTGNGGRGGDAGTTYKGIVGSCGGNGGNGGVFGRGGDGGTGTTTNNSCSASGNNRGGNGGNGYIGGNGGGAGGGGGGLDGTKSGSGGDGGNGIICGGNGASSHAGNGSCRQSGRGGNAINNMYGLILHACEYYNNCIEAQGGKGGNGGSAPHSSASGSPRGGYGGVGGNGANGGKVSVVYIKLLQTGSINVAGGLGGCGGDNYQYNCCCDKAANGTDGTAGWSKLCKPF